MRRKYHGKRCNICKSRKNLDVHHLIYRDLFNIRTKEDLRVLCRKCHYQIHQLQKTGKIVFPNENPYIRWKIILKAMKYG